MVNLILVVAGTIHRQAPTRLGQLHLSSGWGKGRDPPPQKGLPLRAVTFATPPPGTRAAGPSAGLEDGKLSPTHPLPRGCPLYPAPQQQGWTPRARDTHPRGTTDGSNLQPAGPGKSDPPGLLRSLTSRASAAKQLFNVRAQTPQDRGPVLRVNTVDPPPRKVCAHHALNTIFRLFL